ncbi:uncharacterized protein TNCV_1509261 [Trichonephila clavipes]|nr:uncharacterized protein TNCV_1509261 [Trichonephila clavipes]
MEETSEDGDNSSVSDSCSLGSVGSGNNSLDEYPDRKFSHVCILTYWTKDRVVCGVDVGLLYDRWRHHLSPPLQFRHGTGGEGNILQTPVLVVSAPTAHKIFGPTDLMSTYSVCTRRVFGGSEPRPSGLDCAPEVYDPILYWQEQKTIYHDIHSIAIMYMSVMGSSVPCERLFSIAGNIAIDEWNRLDPSRLDRLSFLKSLEIISF